MTNILFIILSLSNGQFDFCLGAMVAGIIVHCICSGYADITSIIEEHSEDAERDAEFWMNYYNQEQKQFFGDN